MAIAAALLLALAAVFLLASLFSKGAQLSRLRDEAAGRGVDAAVARGELAARGAELSALRTQLALRESRINEGQSQLARLQADHAALDATLSERDASSSEQRRDKENQLAELRAEREIQLDEARQERLQNESALESLRSQLRGAAAAAADADRQRAELAQQLDAEHRQSAEKIALLEAAEKRLTDSFQNLSSAALARSSEQLMKLTEARFAHLHESSRGDLAQRQQAIDQLVTPVRAQLEEVGKRIEEMEKARSGAYAGLSEQVKSLVETQGSLRNETQRLVSALRAPQTRGRWAEIHLRRVVELAGMQENCDFLEQESVTNEEGTLRPDMVIKLPGGSQVVIDAKAPLAAWLDAHEAGGPALLDEPQRKELYRAHARQVRNHVESLSRKNYWAQFEKAPDFVVLFLPTEAVLGAALEADPELHEQAMAQRVVLATPMTLIALLRTFAYGWRQDALANNARQISEEARELYERLGKLADHFGAVGKKLRGAVESYNEALGSLERRVLPAARKFKEYRAVPAESELPLLAEIEVVPRTVQSPELLAQVIPDSAN